jgi:hypothetical protein
LDIGYWILDIGYWILDIGYFNEPSITDGGMSVQGKCNQALELLGHVKVY